MKNSDCHQSTVVLKIIHDARAVHCRAREEERSCLGACCMRESCCALKLLEEDVDDDVEFKSDAGGRGVKRIY